MQVAIIFLLVLVAGQLEAAPMQETTPRTKLSPPATEATLLVTEASPPGTKASPPATKPIPFTSKLG